MYLRDCTVGSKVSHGAERFGDEYGILNVVSTWVMTQELCPIGRFMKVMVDLSSLNGTGAIGEANIM